MQFLDFRKNLTIVARLKLDITNLQIMGIFQDKMIVNELKRQLKSEGQALI
jgi:hypothetical protein